MLIAWVREYATREDEFSLREHRRLFGAHSGAKVEYTSNLEAASGCVEAGRAGKGAHTF
jgi:hypothetical protein